jgi:hypothetical protein
MLGASFLCRASSRRRGVPSNGEHIKRGRGEHFSTNGDRKSSLFLSTQCSSSLTSAPHAQKVLVEL